jgi:hypothetical protein
MYNLYFVTETEIKTMTNVGRSVDTTQIIQYSRTSSDMWVRSILGTYFYNHLLGIYNGLVSPSVFTTDEQNLVDNFIVPAVAWRTAAEVVVSATYQLRNKGLQKNLGDYSTHPDFNEAGFMAQHTEQKAQFYENRLLQYLEKNGKAQFPEFASDLNNDSKAKPWDCGRPNDPLWPSGIWFV